MNTPLKTFTKRNVRITARLRRIQGQLAAIERSLVTDPDCTILLQRIAAARGAMSGLMAYLIEERLRTLDEIFLVCGFCRSRYLRTGRDSCRGFWTSGSPSRSVIVRLITKILLCGNIHHLGLPD